MVVMEDLVLVVQWGLWQEDPAQVDLDQVDLDQLVQEDLVRMA